MLGLSGVGGAPAIWGAVPLSVICVGTTLAAERAGHPKIFVWHRRVPPTPCPQHQGSKHVTSGAGPQAQCPRQRSLRPQLQNHSWLQVAWTAWVRIQVNTQQRGEGKAGRGRQANKGKEVGVREPAAHL